MKEPIDKWLNLKDNSNTNILELFYKDKSKWSDRKAGQKAENKKTRFMNHRHKQKMARLTSTHDYNIFQL